MTKQLHNKVLMATVQELMATHQREESDKTSDANLHKEATIKRSNSHGSRASVRSELSMSEAEEEEAARAQRDLSSLDLTLGSYPSADPLHVLGELLCDIRRSCTTSLTSTPISSDGELTAGGADSVFESKLRRSGTELRAMGRYSGSCIAVKIKFSRCIFNIASYCVTNIVSRR